VSQFHNDTFAPNAANYTPVHLCPLLNLIMVSSKHNAAQYKAKCT